MKVFDVRVPKWKPEVWFSLALALLAVVAAFFPLAFQNTSTRYDSLSVGERASCFSAWYQNEEGVTSRFISRPGSRLKQNADDLINAALTDIFHSESVALNAEGKEYLELETEDGLMRFVHAWGFISGSYNGSMDIAVDVDSGKILSVNFEVMPSYGARFTELNPDRIISWLEQNYDFTLLTNLPDEDGLGGRASFEYKGNIVSITYSCSYDSEGYASLSVCCI